MERLPRHSIRAGSAVLLVLVAALAVGCASSGSGETAATDDEISTTAVSTDRQCGATGTYIYLEPGITAARVDAIAEALDDRGLTPTEFLDEAATYAEFRQLFADQPDVLDDVDPADLPQSFRLESSLDADGPAVRAIEELPGVLRVEVATPSPCQQRTGEPTPGG